MSPLVSRIVVGAVGLPVVLGLLYLGGWWLFTIAAVAALIALHEYTRMTRSLRPIALAGYAGVLLALVGAQIGGVDWAVGGFLVTLPLAFVLHWVGTTRQSATVAIASTMLGAAWIGLGLTFVLLIRALPDHGRLASFTVLLAVFAGDTVAFAGGRLLGRHRLAPTISPGKTWEGFVAGTTATIFVTFIALYQDRHEFLSIGRAVVLGIVIAIAAPLGDLFESALKRDMQVKDSGRLLGGHGGMLDRLDAPLFAAIASYYLLRAFGAA